jgi:hypothetical protein
MAVKLSDKGSSTEQRIKENKPVNTTPSDSGIMHSDNWIDEVGAQYKNAANEKIISKNGAFVVLGTDRPTSAASGYGAKGSSRAATIDLVVGRMSSARGGKGVKDGTYVDNNFASDAARIYISQQTDIDTNFGIVEGSVGNPRARSAVGIKADGVRIFGREGVKIVTGKGNNWKGFGLKGETNSLGGKVSQPAPGIELIAGNNTEPRKVYGGFLNPREVIETLQPVAMGYNTRDAFRELSNILDDILGALVNFALIQTTVNTTTAAAFASSGVYPPHGVAAGVIGTANTVGMPTQVLSPLYHARLNKTFDFEFNYLYPFGYKFICSRSVKTT